MGNCLSHADVTEDRVRSRSRRVTIEGRAQVEVNRHVPNTGDEILLGFALKQFIVFSCEFTGPQMELRFTV